MPVQKGITKIKPSTADFIPNVTKFRHGTDHIYNSLIQGFDGSI